MSTPPNACTWPRFWDHHTSVNDPEAAIRLIKEAKVRRGDMLHALSQATSERKAKRQSRRYMQSFSARLACLAMAVEKKLGSAKERDAAAMAIVEAVEHVAVWSPAAERARAIPREKLDGGIRYVFSFGVLDYARQLLVRDVAAALTSPEPTQFMSAGGRPAFEEWLGEEVSHAELVITTDIPSCFDRVLREVVDVGLPLPRRVKEEVFYRPMDTALYLKKTPKGLAPIIKEQVAKVSSSKRGIPQGSAASSVVSERVIARVIRRVEAVSPDARIATFGDNLIVILRNRDIKQSVLHALRSEVETCFGSDVIDELVRRTRVQKPTSWFSFAGKDYARKGSTLKHRLPQKRIDKFIVMASGEAHDAILAGDREKLLKTDRRLKGWLRQSIRFPKALDEGLTLAGQIRGSKLYRSVPTTADPPFVESL